jgi:hypothetical protein
MLEEVPVPAPGGQEAMCSVAFPGRFVGRQGLSSAGQTKGTDERPGAG